MQITDINPEQEIIPAETDQELLCQIIEEEPQPRSAGKKIRPEWIIGAVAVAAALLLAVMVVMSLPHMAHAPAPGETLPQQILLPVEDPQFPLPEETAPQEAPPAEEDPEAAQPQNDAGENGEEILPTVEPIIEPEENPYGVLDFQFDRNNYLYCLRQDSYPGVDVSAFQGDIDWQQVKDSGIRFAMLRLGYRGYESGKLVEDEFIQKNLENTRAVGMPIGAYFFSQALTIKEVDEEIDFMLKVLGDYELHMPIVLDWEIPTPDARTAQMDARTLTALQEYFCQTMVEKGYTPMIYFNWHQSNTLLYLNELEAYPFWLALYQDRMTYPYHVEMWQYTSSGRVPGIRGNVDLNIYLPPK